MHRIRAVLVEAYRGINTVGTRTTPDGAVSESEFRELYAAGVREVLEFLSPSMQEEIAAHNRGWQAGFTNFAAYLHASWIRYYRCYLHLAARSTARSVCDVGGFWGAFPIALRRLGYDVTMTESLQYYSRTFEELFGFIRSQDVNIVDLDPFEKDAVGAGTFDVVTVMAVVEHYPHSLRTFMTNITRMMADDGRIYLEVPNIAFWDKRVQMLFGHTPLVPVHDIYFSEVPFIGHHHEFTRRELRQLAEFAGLSVVEEEAFNYSPGLELRPARFFTRPVSSLAFLLRPDSRELLGILCRKLDAEPDRDRE